MHPLVVPLETTPSFRPKRKVIPDFKPKQLTKKSLFDYALVSIIFAALIKVHEIFKHR